MLNSLTVNSNCSNDDIVKKIKKKTGRTEDRVSCVHHRDEYLTESIAPVNDNSVTEGSQLHSSKILSLHHFKFLI